MNINHYFMHALLSERKIHFQAALDHLSKDLGSLRTGRATPALVEDISVKAYDAPMELKGVASIKTQDAKTLIVDPWDKSLLQAIEKAIRDADIGVSPVVDGTIIRIMLPAMTEENRKQLVKIMKEKIEETRIRIRGARESLREEIIKMEKEKEISEDEKFKMLDEIDKMTKDYTTQAEEMGSKKETEIMTV